MRVGRFHHWVRVQSGLLVVAVGVMLAPITAVADEFSLDLSAANSDHTTGWGAAGHLQWMFNSHVGLDLGYRYLSSLEYEFQNDTLENEFSQIETGLIFQQGNLGPRFQLISGAIVSAVGVENNLGDSVIDQFTPGYRVDADISVPLFSHVRVFGNGGYQGFFDGDIPDQWRWRYGLRLSFGGEPTPLESQQLAQQERDRAAAQEALDNPPVQIDPDVPQYIPRHSSQSLPPIIELSQLCKCYPQGPYTLQLGEFSSMGQAVRALEYRGLRQFFNTVAYERDPQAVFLGQTSEGGSVGFYLGEYQTLEETDNWRRQLRRNGIQARVKRVVAGGGEQAMAADNFATETIERSDQPTYTPEEVARMNSLPGQRPMPVIPNVAAMNEIPADAKPAPDRQAMNSVEEKPVPMMTDTLVVGPVNAQRVEQWLSDPAFRTPVLDPDNTTLPGRHRLVWNAAQNQGWLYLDGFTGNTQLDRWRAWLQSRDLDAHHRDNDRLPVGDIYVYTLGKTPDAYSLSLDNETDAGAVLARLVSPEVLWFQAYQSINDRPLELVVNWSDKDQNYQLLATGFDDEADARRAWQSLSSVGVMPSLE
ncbi:SPOR domain-containing protein [Saccharospirillum mangrovi]|uniref:SPOR domain-containing protein n=1 Tax=Saccharospirillum mangrovi TaxID=2161747 RepID=UPI000E20BC49|nr:SPOR domain-containing protein [Saccharospirillum mangrovi]